MIVQRMQPVALLWALRKRYPVLCGGHSLNGGSPWRQDLGYMLVACYRYADESRPDTWFALFK